jgi:hypothetical protein
MLKGVFIILIKLPRHVSAANCHLQGVTRSLYATPVLSAPRVDVSYGSLGVASSHGGWTHQAPEAPENKNMLVTTIKIVTVI